MNEMVRCTVTKRDGTEVWSKTVPSGTAALDIVPAGYWQDIVDTKELRLEWLVETDAYGTVNVRQLHAYEANRVTPDQHETLVDLFGRREYDAMAEFVISHSLIGDFEDALDRAATREALT